MKIRLVGVELLQAEGQTDMTKLFAFRNFANTPKTATWKSTNNTVRVENWRRK
jgi:hypothetical protein